MHRIQRIHAPAAPFTKAAPYFCDFFDFAVEIIPLSTTPSSHNHTPRIRERRPRPCFPPFPWLSVKAAGRP
jgi:hypothetical protein